MNRTHWRSGGWHHILALGVSKTVSLAKATPPPLVSSSVKWARRCLLPEAVERVWQAGS